MQNMGRGGESNLEEKKLETKSEKKCAPRHLLANFALILFEYIIHITRLIYSTQPLIG